MGARGPRLRRRQALKAPRRLPPRRYAATAPERLDEVCLRLLDGALLSHVCQAPDVPAESSVRRHARLDPEYARALSIAREMGDEAVAGALWMRMQALTSGDDPGLQAAEQAFAAARRRYRGRR